MQDGFSELCAVWNGTAGDSFETATTYATAELTERMKEIQQLSADADDAQITMQEQDTVAGGSIAGAITAQ